jgi:hypothetical protein
MRRKLGLTAAVVAAVAITAFAQAKPDFSGTWTPVPAADAAAGGGGGGRMGGRGGGPMTVKQTADELSVERTMRGNPVTTAYKLDGTETDMTMGQMTAKVSAKWDGDKLVITQKTDNGETTQTWSLADGKLTIESAGGRGNRTTTYTKGS